MRLMKRGKCRITIGNTIYPAALRPLSGNCERLMQGNKKTETLRALLPKGAVVLQGQRVLVENRPYLVHFVRMLHDHVEIQGESAE